jgi:flagellar hook-basal body complex protein FliE
MRALETGALDRASLTSATVIKGSREKENGKGVFMQYLKDAMKETNKLILDSEKLADDFAAGRIDNIHQVLIAAEKADIALQFTMQIRNKIMDAYNEIMRMQV